MEKTKVNQNAVKDALESIREYKGCSIVATIKYVAKSGASRKIKFMAIQNNRLYNLNWAFSKILNIKINTDDSLTIHGGGMDMVFHTLYRINKEAIEIDGVDNTFETSMRYLFDANNYYLI